MNSEQVHPQCPLLLTYNDTFHKYQPYQKSQVLNTEKSFQRQEFYIWPCVMVGVGGAPGRRSPHPSGTHLPLILFPVLCLTLLWPFLWAWVSLFLSFWSDFSGLARVGGQQLLDGVGWGPGVHSPSISGSGGRATVLLTPCFPTWVSELLFAKVSRLCWAGLPSSTQHPASKRAVIALSSPLLLPLLLFVLITWSP